MLMTAVVVGVVSYIDLLYFNYLSLSRSPFPFFRDEINNKSRVASAKEQLAWLSTLPRISVSFYLFDLTTLAPDRRFLQVSFVSSHQISPRSHEQVGNKLIALGSGNWTRAHLTLTRFPLN
jgi:hypothetical protein